jgi:hypothetical protein
MFTFRNLNVLDKLRQQDEGIMRILITSFYTVIVILIIVLAYQEIFYSF